jgi:hypothetical protein
VVQEVAREIQTCIGQVEREPRPGDRQIGQLEALRHVRTFLRSLTDRPARVGPARRRRGTGGP